MDPILQSFAGRIFRELGVAVLFGMAPRSLHYRDTRTGAPVRRRDLPTYLILPFRGRVGQATFLRQSVGMGW